MSASSSSQRVPRAHLRKERRWSMTFLFPLLALALAGWIAYTTWDARGVVITVELDRGHGLAPGAAVRFRDVAIGELRALELSPDGEKVVARIGLDRSARDFARQGTRFWVVRPQLSVDEIAGLDTLVGARYIECAPGEGAPRRQFTALLQAPVVRDRHPGDLEVVLKSSRRAGLRRGAPVTYRQVRIGTVQSVGLTSDGGAVEARIHIEQSYATLLTTQTRFWSTSGIAAEFGLNGFQFEVESLQSVITGGVALATPPGAGEPVTTGHRFELEPEVDEEWLAWEPQVAIGSELLPQGVGLPSPLRGELSWQQGRIGRFLKTDKDRSGWLLLVEGKDEPLLLGPRDLIEPSARAEEGTSALEVAGQQALLVDGVTESVRGQLGLLDANRIEHSVWPRRLLRRMDVPEDCIVIGDRNEDPLPIAADRFVVDGGPDVDSSEVPADSWYLDLNIPVDARWHGAVVVGRTDGKVVGVLLVEDSDEAPVWVARMPGEWLERP